MVDLDPMRMVEPLIPDPEFLKPTAAQPEEFGIVKRAVKVPLATVHSAL